MLLHPPEWIREYRAAGFWNDDTWDSLFSGWVRACPDKLALADPPNRESVDGQHPRRLTWAEIDHEVDRVSGLLTEAGIQRGDVVAVQLPNTVELVITLLAIARLGAIATPFPVTFRRHEVIVLGRHVGIKGFVTTGRVGNHYVAKEVVEWARLIPTLQVVCSFGTELPAAGVVPLHQRSATPPRRRNADPNEVVTICWTSGTESTPKAVPRAHYDWLAIARICVTAPKLTADDVILNPFPVTNMAGIGGMMLPWLISGSVLVQHHPLDLKVFLGQIAKERANYTVAPPHALNMLLADERAAAAADLSSIRCIASGSAPLSPTMVAGFQQRWGISILNMFGSNEGVALLSDPDTIPDPTERAAYFPRPDAPELADTIAAMAGLRTRLVDITTGATITEPGRPGELRIAGPTVFAGYLNDRGQVDQPFDKHGYFATGDVFELAGDRGQYLRYVDRVKDIIIRGSNNVSAAEVEQMLQRHPSVAEVAAIGVPDSILGEKVCAVVVPAPNAEPPTLEALRTFMDRNGVAEYKQPERLEIVEALPRNSLGKVLKRELRTKFGRKPAA